MFIRIQNVPVEKERDTQLVALFEVLEGLVIHTECMYLFFEHRFEVDYDANKSGYGEFCTFCHKMNISFTQVYYILKT